MTIIRALKYVSYRDIPDHLLMGWIAYEPKTFARLNYYGIEMRWICSCKLPGEK